MSKIPLATYGYDSSADLVPPVESPKAGRSGWSRKRKIWTAIGALVAIVIIAVAVAVPVAITKKNKSSDQDLYFPKGLNGTGLNGAIGGRKTNTPYDQLVVFGSSYSDNAHPRDSQYSGSLAPSGYWNGRYTNGPVWVEYLRDFIGNDTQARTGKTVAHLNYAYAGAMTNNSVIGSNVPDTGAQAQAFLADASYDPKTKKALVALFTSTNPVVGAYSRYATSDDPIYKNTAAGLDLVSQSASSLIRQMTGLIPSDTSLISPDFLVLPIPPLQWTPRGMDLAGQYKTDTKVLAELVNHYNEVLLQGAQSLAATLASGSRANVFTYDVVAWMNGMSLSPNSYNIENIQYPCLGSQGMVCPNPERYVFWDNLHITTQLQERLAKTVFGIVRDSK